MTAVFSPFEYIILRTATRSDMAVDRTQESCEMVCIKSSRLPTAEAVRSNGVPSGNLITAENAFAPGSRHKLRTDKGNQQPRYHQQHQSAADHHPTAAEQRAQQGAVTGNPDAVSPRVPPPAPRSCRPVIRSYNIGITKIATNNDDTNENVTVQA